MGKNLTDKWKKRWQDNRIGWHEDQGNSALKKFWHPQNKKCSVLVPFCGKSKDLLWLANQGHNVIGVEISDIAINAFFGENNLKYEKETNNGFDSYIAKNASIAIYCGDYFKFNICGLDALYDRGSLVAVEPSMRLKYIEHTKSLLHKLAYRFIISLDYEEGYVQGPPHPLKAAEVLSFWSDLKEVSSYNDIANSSPRFKKSGLTELIESIWISKSKKY